MIIDLKVISVQLRRALKYSLGLKFGKTESQVLGSLTPIRDSELDKLKWNLDIILFIKKF